MTGPARSDPLFEAKGARAPGGDRSTVDVRGLLIL